ncbi:13357_t:CDS:2 [Entrophospora sp. SA101]|nr:13357_t:CDS:2 [Entrophospora sp. SA101]
MYHYLFHWSSLIPQDLTFDSSRNPPAFVENENTVLEKGSHVRIKIVGTRFDATDIIFVEL